MYRQAEIRKLQFCSQIRRFATTLDSQKGEFVIWVQNVVGLGGQVGFRVFLQVRVARLRFIASRLKSSARNKQGQTQNRHRMMALRKLCESRITWSMTRRFAERSVVLFCVA